MRHMNALLMLFQLLKQRTSNRLRIMISFDKLARGIAFNLESRVESKDQETGLGLELIFLNAG